MKMISIIITTKNEENVIGDLLKSLKKQKYKDFEIILVDNNSNDKTCEIAKKYTNKVFIKGPERSVQRNFGVSKALGEYVLILDADMKLSENVLLELSNVKEKVVIIPEKSFGKGFWVKYKVFEREFYEGEEVVEAPRYFSKELFLEFNGYDKDITGPEDYDLPLRMKKAGIRIGHVKSYIFHNEKNFSPFKSAKKKFYYASKSAKYLQKHPEMAIKQGNLLFRPVFFKKWRKLIKHPILSLGMFFVRIIEMSGAFFGFVYHLFGKFIYSGIIKR